MRTGGGAELTWSGEAKPTNEEGVYGGSGVTLTECAIWLPGCLRCGRDHRWTLGVDVSSSGMGVGTDLSGALDHGKSEELELGARPMTPVQSRRKSPWGRQRLEGEGYKQ